MKEIMSVIFFYSGNHQVLDTFFVDILGESSYWVAMSRLKPIILCHRYHYNLEFKKIQASQIGFFRRIETSLISNISPLPPGLLQFSHSLFGLPPSVIRMLSKKPPLDSIFDTISRLAEKSGAAILGTVGKSGGRISPRSFYLQKMEV
jgi:hypothetical protein